MSKNLNLFDRFSRVVLAAIFIFAAIILFKNPVAMVLAAAGALFSLWEAISAKCYLAGYLGSKSITQRLGKSSLYLLGLTAIQMVLAYQWWSAGWEKISNPEFISKMGGVFNFFASQNPFRWYKEFLLGFAIRNAKFLGYLVEWGQIAVAVALFVAGIIFIYSKREIIKKRASKLSALALIGGIIMNANFYLAAGWTSLGTLGINMIMFWTQLILLYIWLYYEFNL